MANNSGEEASSYLITVNMVVGHQALDGPDGIQGSLTRDLLKQLLVLLTEAEEEVNALLQSKFHFWKQRLDRSLISGYLSGNERSLFSRIKPYNSGGACYKASQLITT